MTSEGQPRQSAVATAPTSPEGDVLVSLADRRATDSALTGAKAAALARAAAADLPVLDGVVLTTAFTAQIDGGASVEDHPATAEAFRLVGGMDHALVVRSSSTAEDQAESSMAGQFDSVVGVRGSDDFSDAVRLVLDSRGRIGDGSTPMGVLIQPLVEPASGGVLFGVDPVTGRSDRRVITAVAGGPEPLVSGSVDGSRYLLAPDGTVIDFERRDGTSLPAEVRRRLLALVDTAGDLFGGPQDVEWAALADRTVLLLQSRHVTTESRGVPDGPVYGPGPVAETFPEPLSTLEADLWVPPLQAAVGEAVLLSGAATEGRVRSTETVIVVNGVAAIDLGLSGEDDDRPSLLQRLNPVPAVRRLRAAWRVGRLRAALPGLGEDLLDRVDADLESVPSLDQLTSRQLVALMARGREVLIALHAHEILMGQLTDSADSRMTGASVALRVLSEARRDGIPDDDIIRHSPVVLALTAPKVCDRTVLPPPAQTTGFLRAGGRTSEAAVVREALRLRVRWVQEITGRAAFHLAGRLADADELDGLDQIHHLTLDELDQIVTQRATPVLTVIRAHVPPTPEPLPAAFQMSDLGRPIPVERPGGSGGGTGAGGGTGTGPVTYDVVDPPTGSVLVTTTLNPGLGPLLPRLAGIVSETGSVLSHLAILARETGVPTVVGFTAATDDLEEGTMVRVDGDTGEVSRADDGGGTRQ